MRILILLIICSLSKALHSQDQDSLIIKNQEISLKKNLNEVVVTGQISALKAEDAIHKIRVISKKTLTSGLFEYHKTIYWDLAFRFKVFQDKM